MCKVLAATVVLLAFTVVTVTTVNAARRKLKSERDARVALEKRCAFLKAEIDAHTKAMGYTWRYKDVPKRNRARSKR